MIGSQLCLRLPSCQPMRRRAGRFPAQERDACCSAESFSASVLPEALLLPEVLADVLWDELPDEEADEL